MSRALLFLLMAALLPVSAPAQGGFRVNPGTGLELGTGDAGTPRNGRKPGAPHATDKKPTEITASKETSFDEKTRTAIFVGEVTVTDEQFNLTCDKMTAYLKKAPQPPKNGEPEKNAGREEGGSGGLERVVAEGNVLIVQEKPDAEGKITRYVGKANRAEYNAATGNVTLSGWPQIQQGFNNQVATEEGTVMILNRSGNLKTIGGSKTVIKESSDPRSLRGGKTETSSLP